MVELTAPLVSLKPKNYVDMKALFQNASLPLAIHQLPVMNHSCSVVKSIQNLLQILAQFVKVHVKINVMLCLMDQYP